MIRRDAGAENLSKKVYRWLRELHPPAYIISKPRLGRFIVNPNSWDWAITLLQVVRQIWYMNTSNNSHVLICGMIQCLRNEPKSSERRDEMHGLQQKQYPLPLFRTHCPEVVLTCCLYTELQKRVSRDEPILRGEGLLTLHRSPLEYLVRRPT